MSLKDTKILKMSVMNNNMFVGGICMCVNIDTIRHDMKCLYLSKIKKLDIIQIGIVCVY